MERTKIGTTTRIRASALCFDDGKWLCVKLCDPLSHTVYLLPPGGEIEPRESPLAAAERETLEETGFTVSAIADTELVTHYLFPWAGKNYQCQTHFFLARLVQAHSQNHQTAQLRESYIKGHEWLSLEALLSAFSFHTELSLSLAQWLKTHQKLWEEKKE